MIPPMRSPAAARRARDLVAMGRAA